MERFSRVGPRMWVYYFKHAFINLFSNRLINAICIGTIFVSFLLFGLFMIFFVNLDNWVTEWGKSSLSMSVYIKDGTDKESIKCIESTLKRLPGAQIVSFIPKEKALLDLKKSLGGQSGLLDGLKGNPLPASFEVTLKDVTKNRVEPKVIKEELEKIGGVEEVQHTEQWQERFEGFLYILRLGGIIIGGFLSIAILFIITNTIKLTIYARREEIEILKLVGATDWFIKIPFLIEGAVQGLLGGFFAVFILYMIHILFFLKRVNILGFPMPEMIFLSSGYIVSLVSMSLLLGFLGGIIAVGRFFH